MTKMHAEVRGDRDLMLGSFLRHHMLSVPQRLTGLAQLIEHIAAGCAEISEHVASCAEQGGTSRSDDRVNCSGDAVSALDTIADEILVRRIEASGVCAGVVSEERALPEAFGLIDAPYLVSMDPLDGSSNLGCAIPVGTIFAVRLREGRDPADPASYLRPGSEQVAAGYVIYGPAVELVLTTGDGVTTFSFDRQRGWRLWHQNVRVPPRGRIYSINEANGARWSPELRSWLESCKEQGYTQRYVGSMVADVHRTLLKGGVFLYPGDWNVPEGKLRLLYEAAPMAQLFEAAGGLASNGQRRLLDLVPRALHERTPVVLGGRGEVLSVERALACKGRAAWRLTHEPGTQGGHRIACAFELGGRRVSGHLQLSSKGRKHQFVSSGGASSS